MKSRVQSGRAELLSKERNEFSKITNIIKKALESKGYICKLDVKMSILIMEHEYEPAIHLWFNQKPITTPEGEKL